MESAIECFSENCTYDDTQYSEPFEGKESLRNHLYRVASLLPMSFEFVIDDMAVSSPSNNEGKKIGVQWHVESNGNELPFTRGCSFYKLDETSNLIESGFDVPEPAVIKPGDSGLVLISSVSKILDEPIRLIPLVIWIVYIYVVFFSNGILPGADATQLELRTWEEVRDLSLNFFLVSPLLKLPFSPVVHPMLEAIFNLLLTWAAMFAAFLSDDREKKPSSLPMLPTIIGMQFLTSAFFLPYLVLRTSEPNDKSCLVYKKDLSAVQRTVGESRLFGLVLGGIGTISIVWGFVGRPEFGDLFERQKSLVDLLSIDRVGSSFVVDLGIFALFQGWLIDDDLQRRGIPKGKDELLLRNIAKYVPFFGLAWYICFRPRLPQE